MNKQSGNVVFIILLAVAVFAALAYAFTQGSRGNVTMMTAEADKANATGDADYTNAINMAIKRLKLVRGCTDAQISYETPNGFNGNPNAPTDGSCHIFKVNGGGIAFKGNDVYTDPCSAVALGGTCPNGTIYVGVAGANRVYIRSSDSAASLMQKTSATATIGTDSANDGVLNTDAMVTAGIALHPAAQACRAHGPKWYLPSLNEIKIVWTNRVAIDATGIGINMTANYWSSQQQTAGPSNAMIQNMSTGGSGITSKMSSFRVRCAYRD